MVGKSKPVIVQLDLEDFYLKGIIISLRNFQLLSSNCLIQFAMEFPRVGLRDS